MDFDTKASNIILVIFPMEIIFQKTFLAQLWLFEWKTSS